MAHARSARSRGSATGIVVWPSMVAALSIVAALGLLVALGIAPPAAASLITSRADLGARVDADLRITPTRFTPGQALVIDVTGTLTTTAKRDVVCHSLVLGALRGTSPLATRYASTDRRVQQSGERHTQQITAALDIDRADVPASGAISITVDLQCSPVAQDGSWSVLDAVTQRIASGRLLPAAGSVSLSTTHLFPDDDERAVRPVTVSATASRGPITVVVMRAGTTVWRATSSKAAYRAAIPLARTQRAGTYTVKVTAGGSTTRQNFRVSRGWAPLVDSVASWPRCSTITWTYNAQGAPGGGDTGLVSDLRVVFDRFAALTGLRFRQESSSTADIQIGWGPAPFDGPDASGGAAERDGVLGSGILTMYADSAWARTPGFGVRGRGALLYHEIGHILGLGHVSDERLLMYPIHTVGQSPLTPQPGDIAGLRELYAPSSCR